MGDPLGKILPFLPDILRRNGYRTAAFVGALVLDPSKLAPGFERGFDRYDAGYHRRRGNEDRYSSLERRGEEVVKRALDWLSKRPAGPFFLWVHLYDPHGDGADSVGRDEFRPARKWNADAAREGDQEQHYANEQEMAGLDAQAEEQ